MHRDYKVKKGGKINRSGNDLGWKLWGTTILLVVLMPMLALGNNIQLGTPTLMDYDAVQNHTHIKFDLSWENSWRDATNRDAAWVFVKYKETGGDWNHAYLNTMAGNHTIPTGYTCSVGITNISGTDRGMGVFIYRSSTGNGANSLTDVKLRWEYGANGLSDDATVIVKVFAIEMVYIPEGNLNLNTTASTNMDNEFTNAGITSITSEAALGEDAIQWSNDNFSGGQGNSDVLIAEYPKGYVAFYCMKYEISQSQYADFLNTLTSTQAATCYPSYDGDIRHTISGSHPNYSAGRPDRACNYLSWLDGCAYADWSALRPMTELEFEKACRGDQSVVTDEFAWGTTNITEATTISGTEDGTETVNGNCCYNNKIFISGDEGSGPLRCGVFATATTIREQAGAGYYGVMELSGNVYERCVTVADLDQSSNTTNAGQFDGSHGDGALSTSGYATNSTWPGYDGVGEVKGALGAGFRGGDWSYVESFARVSDRCCAGHTDKSRKANYGFRVVRSAP